MHPKNSLLEVIVALAVLVVVGFSLGVVYRKNVGMHQKTVLLKAEFDTVGGLASGSPVKLNGVTVGTVQNIHLDTKKNFTAIVAFTVLRSISLPEDTEAAVVSESLFGGKVMILLPGSHEKYLSEGDVIYHTRSPMNLEELVQKFLFTAPDTEKESDPRSVEDKDHKEESCLDSLPTTTWRSL